MDNGAEGRDNNRLFPVPERGAPRFKGFSETLDLLPQKVQIFLFLYPVFFKAVAIRHQVSYHYTDVYGTLLSFGVGALAFGQGYFLWNENGIRQ